MILARVICSIALVSMLNGCQAAECGSYTPYVTDDRITRSLSEWSDREIFSRNFAEDDFNLGHLVGPGRSGAFAPESIKTLLPALVGDEIRPIGPNPLRPSGVFIGSMSYRGIFIARTDLNQMLEEASYTNADFVVQNERVALICADAR